MCYTETTHGEAVYATYRRMALCELRAAFGDRIVCVPAGQHAQRAMKAISTRARFFGEWTADLWNDHEALTCPTGTSLRVRPVGRSCWEKGNCFPSSGVPICGSLDCCPELCPEDAESAVLAGACSIYRLRHNLPRARSVAALQASLRSANRWTGPVWPPCQICCAAAHGRRLW